MWYGKETDCKIFGKIIFGSFRKNKNFWVKEVAEEVPVGSMRVMTWPPDHAMRQRGGPGHHLGSFLHPIPFFAHKIIIIKSSDHSNLHIELFRPILVSSCFYQDSKVLDHEVLIQCRQ